MTELDRPGAGGGNTPLRSTAESLHAISEQLRLLERERAARTPVTNRARSFAEKRPWAVATTSFLLGFTVTRVLRTAIGATRGS